ncbi:MAG: pentapeptide repeat-containing protein [Bacteroidota bacterium]
MRLHIPVAIPLLILFGLQLCLSQVSLAQDAPRLRTPAEIWVEGTSLDQFLEIHSAGLKSLNVEEKGVSDQDRVAEALNEFLEERGLSLRFLKEADLSRADLEDEDLRYLNLKEATLRGAVLDGSDLRYADLKEATLQGASLKNADLRHANLKEAKLSDARLEGADLRKANLKEAQLENADFDGCNLSDVDLHEASGLTLKQLISARTIRGANLPEGYRIRLQQVEPEVFER